MEFNLLVYSYSREVILQQKVLDPHFIDNNNCISKDLPMKAFIPRKQEEKQSNNQKFKFKFVCEFELDSNEIWEGDPPSGTVRVTDVLNLIEEDHSDAVDFLAYLTNSDYVDGSQTDLDIEEIVEEKVQSIEGDSGLISAIKRALIPDDGDDPLKDGSIAETSLTLNAVVGNMVASEAISELVRA